MPVGETSSLTIDVVEGQGIDGTSPNGLGQCDGDPAEP